LAVVILIILIVSTKLIYLHNSFIHLRNRFSFGKGRGGNSPNKSRNTSWFSENYESSAGSTQDGTEQGRRCHHVPRAWL